MLRPILVAALAPSASAAILVPIYGETPPEVKANPAAHLQVNQMKPSNTQLDVLADDEPSAWVGSGGASSSYWVLRSTPKMTLWTVDNGPPWIQTIDDFDLRPYANSESLELVVTYAIRSVSTITRTYRANGEYVAFSYPRGVPEPSTLAMGVLFGLSGVYYLRHRRSSR